MALEFIRPTYSPVKSVNGMTGDVVIEIPEADVDLTGYATEAYVDKKVAEAATGGEINLDAYATKTYVDDAIAAIDIPDASGVSEDRVNELIDERSYVNEDRAREIANEVCDERGTGGSSDVNLDEYLRKDELGMEVGIYLENDFRYIFQSAKPSEEYEVFQEITDGDLWEFSDRFRMYGNRFVLYIEGKPAEVTASGGYYDEGLGMDLSDGYDIYWVSRDNVAHSWDVRDVDGWKSRYHGNWETTMSESRVIDLINEYGGGSSNLAAAEEVGF